MTQFPSLAPDPRYDRQSRLRRSERQWNQARLARARALVVGVGNIGAPATIALAQAGFQHLTLVDLDHVSVHNLSRSAVFSPDDVGQPKAEVVRTAVRRLNPEAEVEVLVGDVCADFGLGRFATYDVIALAPHDLATRRHVNRWAHCLPGRVQVIVEGGLEALSFSVQSIVPGESACYTCPLSPDQPDDGVYQGCNGVVREAASGPAPTTGADGMAVAALMAKEAALVAAGLPPFFADRELRFDGERGSVGPYERQRRRSCEDHRPADPDRVIDLPFGPDTPLAALHADLARELGVEPDRVRLASPQLLTRSMRCVGCGHVTPVHRPQRAPLATRCPRCGRVDPDGFTLDVGFALEPALGATPADHGLPEGLLLEAAVGGDRWLVVPESIQRLIEAAPGR